MKNPAKLLLIALAASLFAASPTDACTSLVASGRATPDGRPILWKHRDTDAPSNYLARVEPGSPGEIGFVGLFNAGDSIMRDAWAGMNDAGFAIMNTASYNLAPDTTDFKDREAVVMGIALRRCRTVADFAALLDSLPRPLGVQANFGVIDARGGAAYFETWDHGYIRFNADEDPSGCLIRTNFSFSGKQDGSGSGYIRYDSARKLIETAALRGKLMPGRLTDIVSRSFYHSLMERDPLRDGDKVIADGEFIPRRISTASIVVSGAKPGEEPGESMKMRAALGYPPLAEVFEFDLKSVPEPLGPSLPGRDAPAARRANDLRDKVFHFTGSDRRKYIDLEVLRELMKENALKD